MLCVSPPHKWLASPQCSHFTPQQFLWKPQEVRPIKVFLDLKRDTRWIFERLRAVWVSLWKRRIGGAAVRRIPVKLRLFLAKEVPVNYFLPLCPLFASLSVSLYASSSDVTAECCALQQWLICMGSNWLGCVSSEYQVVMHDFLSFCNVSLSSISPPHPEDGFCFNVSFPPLLLDLFIHVGIFLVKSFFIYKTHDCEVFSALFSVVCGY